MKVNANNPYKIGCQLYSIFERMKNGIPFSAKALQYFIYDSYSYQYNRRDNRRITSALRDIRRHDNRVEIIHLGKSVYQMLDSGYTKCPSCKHLRNQKLKRTKNSDPLISRGLCFTCFDHRPPVRTGAVVG